MAPSFFSASSNTLGPAPEGCFAKSGGPDCGLFQFAFPFGRSSRTPTPTPPKVKAGRDLPRLLNPKIREFLQISRLMLATRAVRHVMKEILSPTPYSDGPCHHTPPSRGGRSACLFFVF